MGMLVAVDRAMEVVPVAMDRAMEVVGEQVQVKEVERVQAPEVKVQVSNQEWKECPSLA
jgi:hypothetical protein